MIPEFAPGEAEAKVKLLRQHLHRARDFQENLKHSEAKQEERLAHALASDLLKGLEKVIEHHVRTLTDYGEDRKDARQEMMCKLWAGITGSCSQSEARGYETGFWKVAKWRILNVCTKVRKEEKKRLLLVSLDAPENFGSDQNSENRVDHLPNPHATRQIEQVLNRDEREQFIEQLSPQQRAVFVARLNGDTWEVAAQKAATSKKPRGITPKTAAKYFDEAITMLKQLLIEEDAPSIQTQLQDPPTMKLTPSESEKRFQRQKPLARPLRKESP